MRKATPILSISGSDSTGQSGIQADIQTIAALGGHALTAVTCISDFALPSEVVLAQVSSIISTFHPKAIKVGLVTDAETIRLLRNEVIATRRLVVAPGIFDADGKQMIDDEAIKAIARYLVPEALLLMLRCKDAEKLLGLSIKTDDDMLEAAKQLRDMGAEWVLLRGGQHTKGRLTALLFGPEKDNVQSSMFNGFHLIIHKAGKSTAFQEHFLRLLPFVSEWVMMCRLPSEMPTILSIRRLFMRRTQTRRVAALSTSTMPSFRLLQSIIARLTTSLSMPTNFASQLATFRR